MQEPQTLSVTVAEINKISLRNTGYHNQLMLDYLFEPEKIKQLFHYSLSLDEVPTIIKDKQEEKIDRKQLVETILQQYKNIDTNVKVKDNIHLLLSEKTFTITTAHQPSLFTGPLYFIYKILSAIKVAQMSKEKFPGYDFVPVYWLGGEDHDFEEINHLNIYGNRLEWQHDEKGAVGRMNTSGIEKIIDELEQIIGNNPNASDLIGKLHEFFDVKNTFALATQKLVDFLFQDYGLVIIDQDDVLLKKSFLPVILEEVLAPQATNEMQETLEFLDKEYKIQAAPREINFFYLIDQTRERIVKDDDGNFSILNTDFRFTKPELEKEINDHPERFSPNVILRPVYQQKVLPNIAYIGGGGELSYWLQLKPIFEANKVNFPMLILRDSAAWINKNQVAKLNTLDIKPAALFGDTEQLVQKHILKISEEPVELNNEKLRIQELFDLIKEKAIQIDPTLEKSVDAEQQKILNAFNNLESKFIRAEKRKHDSTVAQIRNIKSKIFPDNNLQERVDSFIPYYLQYQKSWFDRLLEDFNPFDKQFKIFLENRVLIH